MVGKFLLKYPKPPSEDLRSYLSDKIESLTVPKLTTDQVSSVFDYIIILEDIIDGKPLTELDISKLRNLVAELRSEMRHHFSTPNIEKPYEEPDRPHVPIAR